jgi:hypothetical protein
MLGENNRLKVYDRLVQRQLFESNKGQAWGVGNGFSSFYY